MFAVYCVAANVAIAIFPSPSGRPTQSARFLSVQKSLEHRLPGRQRAPGVGAPYWAPAGQLFAGNCSGLYLSTGDDMKDVPGQQIEHYNWMPVEQPSAFTHDDLVHLQSAGAAFHPAGYHS